MYIHADFESYEEMMEFAAKLQQKAGEQMKQEKTEPVMIDCPSVEQPVPVQQTQTVPVQQAQPVPVQQAQPSPVQPIQTAAPSYTLDDLCSAAMTLMDKGMQGQLQQLLAGYGVASLPELPKEQYGVFANALREMGAQI